MKKTTLLLLLMAVSTLIVAASTGYHTSSSIEDFQKGEFDGVTINEKGQLQTAPQSTLIFDKNEMFVWDMIMSPQGVLYAATGIEGRLYAISGTNARIMYQSQTLSIKALALAPSGKLYAATSPDAQILAFSENGTPEKLRDFEETYIWDMCFGSDGMLYAVTGNPARLYKVNPRTGAAEMLYEAPRESHFLKVAANKAGSVYFASEGNGILYKRDASGVVHVLFDSYENEISSLHINDRGTVYFGTASQRRKPLPGNFAYTDTLDVKEAEEQGPKAQRQEGSGNDDAKKRIPLKNSVYKIGPSGTVEKIFTREDTSFFSLISDSEGRIYAGTGDFGVLYMIDKDETATRVLRLPQGQILSMLLDKNALYLGTGNNGQVYRLDFASEQPGTYTSQVFDAHSGSRWGALQWQAEVPAGCRLEFFVRSGNTAQPDESWSEWKGPIVRSGTQIPFAHTRFLQYRIRMTGRGSALSPTLDSVTLPFLRENRAPRVSRIQIFSQKDAEENKELTLQPGQSAIVWFAEDDDGDTMLYSLFFRFDNNQQWYLLRDRLSKNSITFHTSLLPDGYYYFKVVASDIPANSDQRALSGEAESRRFLIDNTAPEFTHLQARIEGDSIIITGRISDALSNITSLRYSLNARAWHHMDPADLVFDQKTEDIYLKLDRRTNPYLLDGNNTIIFRATDAMNNARTVSLGFSVRLLPSDRASSVQRHPYLLDYEE